ncbi:DUF1611 domain-containing protein [Sphingomonas sp. MMS24-JH45]
MTGLLHGAQPAALVLCHDPVRPHMRGLPHYPMPDLAETLEANVRVARLTSCRRARDRHRAQHDQAGRRRRAAAVRRDRRHDRASLHRSVPLRCGTQFVDDCYAQKILHAAHDRFGLSHPFRISRGVKTAADVVTVTIRAGDVVGRGEGVPYPRYGESVESALAAIEGVRGLMKKDGASRDHLAAAMPAGAARNAVDCALWDLEARTLGEAVALPNGSRPRSRSGSTRPRPWRRSRRATPTCRCSR